MRGESDILMLGDKDEKDDDLIKKTLASKHLEARDVNVYRLPQCDSCPTLIDIAMTE